MEKVHGTVAWYQQKIGSYDKQLWEQSVEQKGIKQAPRRSVRPKTELIDVDLVRGSTFSKSKPQIPWTYITLKTFSRVLLCPFHYKWWIQQTSLPFWMLLMVLYCMQIFTIIVFFNNVGEELTRDEQSLSEVVTPCVLMVFLGLMHSQSVLTHVKPHNNKRDGWRRKRSLSQNRNGVINIDIVNSPSTPGTDFPSPSQSRSSLKGHLGSRPLRERTKERKVRLKTNNQRPSLRREKCEKLNAIASQDSESAYNTHEASDSLADKTSSLEQDSSDKREGNSLDSELDISTRVSVSGSASKGSKNEAEELISRNAFCKSTESQESDFPDDSNSEKDSHEAHLEADNDDKTNKRHSQSISSDNEDDESESTGTLLAGKPEKSSAKADADQNGVHKENKTGKKNDECWADILKLKKEAERKNGLNQKINLEGISHKESAELHRDFEQTKPSDKVTADEFVNGFECDSSFVNVSLENVSSHTLTNGAENQNVFTCEKPSEKLVGNSSLTGKDAGIVTKPTVLNSKISDPKLKYSAHVASAVHFNTKDLVKLREITPKSSRETTPTHTQSDMLLQNKHQSDVLLHSQRIRENNSKSDTESELSDNEVKACKILPNVRRRKVTVQDCVDGNGTTLRNRRTGLPLREAKANSTGVSSSDGGETEGLSSSYSRGSIKNMASSEEWGDHLQSDVDSTSETSSCDSETECKQDEVLQDSDNDAFFNLGPIMGTTNSSPHVINLLQPTRKPSSTGMTGLHVPDKVTCIIWERNECKKIELTAMDIAWAIMETVDKIRESSDYIWIGLSFSMLMGLTPLFFQGFHHKDLPSVLSWESLYVIQEMLFSHNTWRTNLIHFNAVLQRLCLSAMFFFMLSVADRTFKQRLLYAKHFCYLTSSRRARKFDMPHFRLNKVRNIRTWLSLRSYLKKRGPQRSVDVIVSASFMLTLIMLIMMCLQLLRDAEIYLNYLCNWEILVWCLALGVYLLRFMTLGLRINKKYRNLSVLITEQINLYLQMEQKPHKKDELMVANNVLKLAESLLKEIESPFKISGISANPFIINVTRVVVLSAFSAVVSEVLGFKLKLYKIKLRA